jgi:hypothetical protein
VILPNYQLHPKCNLLVNPRSSTSSFSYELGPIQFHPPHLRSLRLIYSTSAVMNGLDKENHNNTYDKEDGRDSHGFSNGKSRVRGDRTALQLGPKKRPLETFSEYICHYMLTVRYRSTQDPLVHHGRHFGRTIHTFCDVHMLLLNAITRLGESFSDEDQIAEEHLPRE